jgi:hypothetical protein
MTVDFGKSGFDDREKIPLQCSAESLLPQPVSVYENVSEIKRPVASAHAR